VILGSAVGSLSENPKCGLLEHRYVPYRSSLLIGGGNPPGEEKVFHMQYSRLEPALDLLIQVRRDIHDVADAHVIDKLDEAILVLKDQAPPNEQRRQKALVLLGEALKYLPAIKSLFEDLM